MNIAFSRRTFISTAAVASTLTAAATLPPHRDLVVSANGFAQMGGRALRCAIGRGGIRLDKREGDGATPQGRWRMRGILYRADRMAAPASLLPRRALRENDGWCDAPSDARYNRSVKLPYPASAEALWRTDPLYDLIVVLGFNDAPVVRGAGSAIFLHIARENYAPTAGCIAFKPPDLLAILSWANKESCVVVKA